MDLQYTVALNFNSVYNMQWNGYMSSIHSHLSRRLLMILISFFFIFALFPQIDPRVCVLFRKRCSWRRCIRTHSKNTHTHTYVYMYAITCTQVFDCWTLISGFNERRPTNIASKISFHMISRQLRNKVCKSYGKV